jgi:hypothetical protein
MSHPSSRAGRRGAIAAAAALLLAASLPLAAGAASQDGFKTKQPSMVVPGPDAPLGTEIKPIMTVGDTIGSYRFEAIPDGISYWQSGKNEATVLVNHETSTVPFGYNLSPTISNSFNDFDNSLVSELVIRNGGQVLSAELVIDNGDGYQRFCSNFLATTDGFEDRPLLFTNEEGIDWVSETASYRNGDSWTNATSLEGADGARQIGVVVAYDPETGENQPIWGMGRHNHENTLPVPGYGYPFLLSGDDAFVSNPAQSQVYAYKADDADAVWNDEGTLYAFVPDDEFATIDSYYDFPVDANPQDAGSMQITGKFIPVPREIATGRLVGSHVDMLSSDVPEFAADGTFLGGPYDPPPSDGTWQRPPGQPVTNPPNDIQGIDGPQWILETWSDMNNVFEFTRIEDMAFDKRPGKQNVVYLVDSGRGSASTSGNPFASTNGRVWKMVLDEEDPTVVTSLSVIIEGDDSPLKAAGEIHQPDNIESTLRGLLVTEDPGSGQQFAPADQGLPNATTARLMYQPFGSNTASAVLKVDQSADEGPTDEDLASARGNWGAWETSGIIDVSSVFGPGKFLINVQAHTLYVDVDTTSAPNNLNGANDPLGTQPDWQYKREGGQLVLVTLPGL